MLPFRLTLSVAIGRHKINSEKFNILGETLVHPYGVYGSLLLSPDQTNCVEA